MAQKKKTAKSALPVPWWRGRGAKRALLGAAAVVAAAAVYAGYWNTVAAQLRTGIGQWTTERRAEGYEVSYGALTIGGFPFRLVAALASPEIAAPKDPKGPSPWAWKGPDMVFTARPWRLNRIKVQAPGLHQVTFMGADYFIDAVDLTGKVRLRRGGLEKIRLSVRDLVVRNAADRDVAGAAAADMAVDGTEGGTGFTVAVEVKGLLLPREPIPGLGRKTARLGFEAGPTGDFPDILRRMPVNGETMARWRDGGGTIEVGRLDINHGSLTVSGDGTLALDQAMQPIGSFTFRVAGYMEALDRLRQAGLIDAQSHGLARLVLTALAGKQGADGKPGLTVPLTVQDRRVFIGPVPLARLPLLRWP